MLVKKENTPRMARHDGDQTKMLLIDVAGRLFAQKGYLAVSSKEICQCAKLNIAAVNYHFVNKEGLYHAVLLEADQRILSTDTLQQLDQAYPEPLTKLKHILLAVMVQVFNKPDDWHFKVLLREVMSPSGTAEKIAGQLTKPKSRLLRRLIGRILGLPSHHSLVQEALACCFAPCLVLLIGTAELRKKLLPALERRHISQAENMVNFSMAGLTAFMQKATN